MAESLQIINGVLTPQQLKSIPQAPLELKQAFKSCEEYQHFKNKYDNPLTWMIDRNAIKCVALPVKTMDIEGNIHEGYFSSNILLKFGVKADRMIAGTAVKLLGDTSVHHGVICKNSEAGVFFPAVIQQQPIEEICHACLQPKSKSKDKTKKNKVEGTRTPEKRYSGYFLMLGEDGQLFCSSLLPKANHSKNHHKVL